MTDDKRTVHVQRITVNITAADENVLALDALNERIKRFFSEDIVAENDLDRRYDGIAYTVDAQHFDVAGTDDEWDEMERQLNEAGVPDPGFKVPDSYDLPDSEDAIQFINDLLDLPGADKEN